MSDYNAPRALALLLGERRPRQEDEIPFSADQMYKGLRVLLHARAGDDDEFCCGSKDQHQQSGES